MIKFIDFIGILLGLKAIECGCEASMDYFWEEKICVFGYGSFINDVYQIDLCHEIFLQK